MKRSIINYIRKDPVLAASLLLAAGSMCWVKPSAAYIDYIDFRVLGILLSLMLVMAGFQKNGFFDLMGSWLLERCTNVTQLCLVLTFLCFFLSMLITNDVALITFVPFAIMTLKRSGREDLMIPVLVSQTLGANLGSMLTPLGNPQNLFLYNLAGYSIWEFGRILFPYTLASGILLLIMQFVITRGQKGAGEMRGKEGTGNAPSVQGVYHSFWKNGVYGLLFLLSLLVVFRLVPYYAILAVIVLAVLMLDRVLLVRVDYSLLLTFIFFFIFTGNLGQIDAVKEMLGKMLDGREVWIGILSSQVISNVPATLLLSGFTDDYRSLLIGVDLGGLGTLIASMASLISYKLYALTEGAEKGKYILYFSVCNVVFLILLSLLRILL